MKGGPNPGQGRALSALWATSPTSYVIFCHCCLSPPCICDDPQPCGSPGLREYAPSLVESLNPTDVF